ncbi:MAG TPA: hypothetical protein VNA13_00875 [Xanthomonadales bacterium]|nr:hypothetical protein [Xanthomonadales bacterium]
MNYKDFFGITATVIAFISYIPYLKDIFSGSTKPHAFSWLIWGSLTAIGFAGQVAESAGPGAWVTGFTAFVALFIFVLSLVKGERNIALVDWLCLFGAFVALVLWAITKGPLLSVILITIIDALGFFPTFRKSYFKPYEETLSTYLLSGLKFVIAFFALTNVTVVTYLYPFSLVLMNWAFVAMLIIRRRGLGAPQKK